jgi:hypothetical protein
MKPETNIYERRKREIGLSLPGHKHLRKKKERNRIVITWYATARERKPLSANLSITACTLRSISDLLCARFRI